MENVETGGNTFQVRKVPAFPDQMLLAKAWTPVAADLLPIIIKVLTDPALMVAAKEGKPPPELMLEFLETGMAAVQKLSNEELLSLTTRSLAAVQIKQGEAGWAAIMSPQGMMMFPLELPVILELMFKVFEVNLLGFFFGGRGTSPGGPPKE